MIHTLWEDWLCLSLIKEVFNSSSLNIVADRMAAHPFVILCQSSNYRSIDLEIHRPRTASHGLKVTLQKNIIEVSLFRRNPRRYPRSATCALVVFKMLASHPAAQSLSMLSHQDPKQSLPNALFSWLILSLGALSPGLLDEFLGRGLSRLCSYIVTSISYRSRFRPLKNPLYSWLAWHHYLSIRCRYHVH